MEEEWGWKELYEERMEEAQLEAVVLEEARSVDQVWEEVGIVTLASERKTTGMPGDSDGLHHQVPQEHQLEHHPLRGDLGPRGNLVILGLQRPPGVLQGQLEIQGGTTPLDTGALPGHQGVIQLGVHQADQARGVHPIR